MDSNNEDKSEENNQNNNEKDNSDYGIEANEDSESSSWEINNANYKELSERIRKSFIPISSTYSNYIKTIQPILKQQELLKSLEPLTRMQYEIDWKGIELINSSLHDYYKKMTKSLSESMKPLMGESLLKMISSYNFDVATKITIPIQQFLYEIDFSPLYRTFKQLKGFNFSKYNEKLNKIVVVEMFDAKWFPHALSINDGETLSGFFEIIQTTRKSKNRIKKIDKLIFTKYNKNAIEVIKKKWRQKNIPEHKMRMMHQAVQAYHRKEYAITVVMLSTLWEGIIYDKVNDTRGKTGKRTKEDFKKLIEQTNYDILFSSFFDEYIMYDCRSEEQVKEDVPGRNSSAHSWYSKYPSKKAGLNAIIFTDFLMNLELPREED